MKNLQILKSKLVIIMIALCFGVVSAEAKEPQTFPLVKQSSKTFISISSDEAKVVKIAASLLVSDINNISGERLTSSEGLQKYSILAGTIGINPTIDHLIKEQKIDVSTIKNRWESYQIQVLENPTENCEKALVIVGSDRRGTAYGLLEVSRMIGVSPWEWWADVTPEKRSELTLQIEAETYGSPSVKYRGIFLNDEDWGLQRWAALNFEPETGDIGPKTYAKIFELMLRLRANTIWPAMHSSTQPFYFYPKNKEVADDYAIVVGTSHCEPMLCNINMEWHSKTMGEWRYDNNADTIKNLFAKRTQESANFESIYTMGMRGEHDSPMIVGEDDSDSQAKLLEKVIADQRDILAKTTGRMASDIPQVFIPYKEVLSYYKKGINVPDDVTLVWTDDNYGYIRQLSNPQEQQRIGGAGIYYHTSYWGRPHDYLWLNSTNPVLMWEEMEKAYTFQSRNLWILNAGDIKPHEYNIELFLDMAWNMEDFKKSDGVKNHLNAWAAREFGEPLAEKVTELMYEYNRLAFQRRPEFMAWSQVEPVTKAGDSELTNYHYGDEVYRRIADYQKLLDDLTKIESMVPPHRKDAFYQLVLYPLIGAAKLNQKWLYAYKNEFAAKQGRLSASWFGEQSLQAFKRIEEETEYYNKKLKGGKWNHIMNMAPRQLPVFTKPTINFPTALCTKPSLGLALESYQMEVNDDIINSYADVLPVFNAYTNSKYYVDVFLKGEGELTWHAKPLAPWIKLSSAQGNLSSKGALEQRLWVTIDWEKVPKGENKKEPPLGHDYQLIPPSYKVNSAIEFSAGDESYSIGVSAFNPKLKALAKFKGFVEDKGFISIDAENYSRAKPGKNNLTWEKVVGLGYTGNSVRAVPLSAQSLTNIDALKAQSPVLEYDFYSFNFGKADIYLQAVPTHAFNDKSGVRVAVAIDNADPVIVDFQTFGRSDSWKQNVLRNAAIMSVDQIINKAGKHTLKVWMVDPGVMLDKVLIDLGGWKSSYDFPPQTYYPAAH